MKFNLIPKNLYNSLSLQGLKKFIHEKKISTTNLLNKIKNKKNLFKIIQNYNLSQSAICLQSHFRRKIAQNLLSDLKSQKINLTDTYHNDSNLCGDEIKDIPKHFIFHYQSYIFDLRELYKNYHLNQKLINPYTNQEFEESTKTQIIRICKRLQAENYTLLEENIIPEDSVLTVKFGNFYSRLNDLHCYTDSKTFNSFVLSDLYDFSRHILSNRFIQTVVLNRSPRQQLQNILKNNFERIPENYLNTFIINDFYQNPFQNYLSDDENINNNFEINDIEFFQYFEIDKPIINLFIENCLDLLITLLNKPNALTIALIINENINETIDFDDFIFLHSPIILFSNPNLLNN